MNSFQGTPETPRDLGPFERPDSRSMVSGIPKRKRMVFNGPEDTPKGVILEKTQNGYVLRASLANWVMGVLFGLGGLGCLLLMLSAMAKGQVPTTWMPIMGTLTAAMSVCSLVYFLSKAVMRLEGEWISFDRKFLGITLTKKISIAKLKRLSITKEQVMVGSLLPASESTRSIRRPKIRIETADDNWEFGVNLSDAHQQYFRFMIEFHYRQWKAAQAPNKYPTI